MEILTLTKWTLRIWERGYIFWISYTLLTLFCRGTFARKQTIVTSRTDDGGQGAPKCMYSFVVNELDSAKCPLLLQHMYGYQREQPLFRQGSRSDADYDSLLQRIETIEKKMFKDASVNRGIQMSLEQQEDLVKSMQITILRQEANRTKLLKTVSDVTHKVRKAKNHYKDIEAKLAGAVMDIATLGEGIRKSDKEGRMGSLKNKHISVKSAALSNSCGLGENATKFTDCEDVYLAGHTYSGVYYITPIYSNCPVPVFCDMETPPGGWLVIQQRHDGSVNFDRNWEAHRKGFGEVTSEHWLGLDTMFFLTNQLHYKLRVDLWDFYGSRVYAEYRHFRVAGARDNYRLHVSNHTGTAPDGFSNHNGFEFSASDKDNDGASNYHCAKEWGAGWWYNNCWFVILNGPYYNNTDVKYRGISWNDWKTEQLMKVEMKIRPYGGH